MAWSPLSVSFIFHPSAHTRSSFSFIFSFFRSSKRLNDRRLSRVIREWWQGPETFFDCSSNNLFLPFSIETLQERSPARVSAERAGRKRPHDSRQLCGQATLEGGVLQLPLASHQRLIRFEESIAPGLRHTYRELHRRHRRFSFQSVYRVAGSSIGFCWICAGHKPPRWSPTPNQLTLRFLCALVVVSDSLSQW